MLDSARAAAWVRRWDQTQEHYADHREARFAVMIAAVEEAVGEHRHPVVVDLGAGPGSLAARVAERVPAARIVAVEADPMLAALGKAWCGHAVEFTVIEAGAPDWRAQVSATPAHAVLASSALHYPPLPRLRELYADIAAWLTPGGILVNADHFPDLGAASHIEDEESTEQPWSTWWRQAAAAEELAPLFALRSASFAEGAGGQDNLLTAAAHLELLAEVGFMDGRVRWHRDRSGVVVAHR